MGAAPTGREVAFTGINISRLEGGKISDGLAQRADGDHGIVIPAD